ncbi:hypothetical protein HOD75_01805 [archaeon]|jgi:hypothetical protein|nr:hypothetical protein [archaeon]MBT4241612.1 hypothetical protein [archaeon]MBT4418007.1 hypothetical protein [archaeon]
MDKKAQAAMEFMMTYGWAILAAVIAIGVLGYMGVFTPGTTDTAIVSSPFYVNAHNAQAGGVNLELKNNGGETYNITSVVVSGCGTNATATSIATQAMEVINVNCTLTAGDTLRGDITITYNKVGSGVSETSTGSIASKVTA